MSVLLFFCVALSAACFQVSSGSTENHGTYFQLKQGRDIKEALWDDPNRIITRQFQECGVENTCKRIAKNKSTEIYSKISGNSSGYEKYDEIWEKIGLKNMFYGNCKEAQLKGIKNNGKLEIYTGFGFPVKVYCDMTTDGGGWTIIQRRVDASTDFNRTWQEYKQGFGDPASNFWIGLDHINSLTSEGRVRLRIDLRGFESMAGHCTYGEFKISDEAGKYAVTTISSFTGRIGDSMGNTVGRMFSTWDRDNDNNEALNCASRGGGAWWYGNCSLARLNSKHPMQADFDESSGILWTGWLGDIAFTEMKIRRED